MKKLLTFLLFIFLPFFLQAENETRLVIVQKSGNETILTLSSHPVLTFESESMIVDNEYVHIVISIDDISYYKFDSVDGISEIPASPIIKSGHVIFSNIPKGTKAYIFTLDGKVIFNQTTGSDSIVDINIDNLSKGTYIVKVGKYAIKVTNKK